MTPSAEDLAKAKDIIKDFSHSRSCTFGTGPEELDSFDVCTCKVIRIKIIAEALADKGAEVRAQERTNIILEFKSSICGADCNCCDNFTRLSQEILDREKP